MTNTASPRVESNPNFHEEHPVKQIHSHQIS